MKFLGLLVVISMVVGGTVALVNGSHRTQVSGGNLYYALYITSADPEPVSIEHINSTVSP